MHVSSESVVAVAESESLLSSASVVVSSTCPWMILSGSALVLMQSVDRDRERVHLIILLSLVVVVVTWAEEEEQTQSQFMNGWLSCICLLLVTWTVCMS